jgi:hypothetical protein
MSVRKLLKTLGVTVQREIEVGVREQLAAGELKGDETLEATATVTVRGLSHDVVGVRGDRALLVRSGRRAAPAVTWVWATRRGETPRVLIGSVGEGASAAGDHEHVGLAAIPHA